MRVREAAKRERLLERRGHDLRLESLESASTVIEGRESAVARIAQTEPSRPTNVLRMSFRRGLLDAKTTRLPTSFSSAGILSACGRTQLWSVSSTLFELKKLIMVRSADLVASGLRQSGFCGG